MLLAIGIHIDGIRALMQFDRPLPSAFVLRRQELLHVAAEDGDVRVVRAEGRHEVGGAVRDKGRRRERRGREAEARHRQGRGVDGMPLLVEKLST